MFFAAGGVAVAAVMLGLAWSQQWRLMYFPDPRLPPPETVGLAEAEQVRFQAADGTTLAAWFLAAPGGTAHLTVLVFNGNGGNRALRAPLALALHQQGFHVLLTDYRGFGGNPGTPSEQGLALDARAARAYLAARPDVDPARIVYYGESLGTGVAVRLADEQPPVALILRSPFTSMADIARHHYSPMPVQLLLRDRYPSIERIGRIRAPLLVVAGDRDHIVPLDYSRRLYDAAPEPKRLVVVPGADHNDAELLTGRTLIGAIVSFLQPLA
jgi:fermentation-respiration switch protein FrsA (DUF1100 family)